VTPEESPIAIEESTWSIDNTTDTIVTPTVTNDPAIE
jgi:hypothetical protein